jgi:hypothetical protein
MFIESTRQALADVLKEYNKHGYAKEERGFRLAVRKNDIRLFLSTRVYAGVQKVLRKKDKHADVFAEVERYLRKKPRGASCEIVIKKKNQHDILGIIYLIGVNVAELDRELEKRRQAEKEEEKERARQLAEEVKKRRAEERRLRIEKEREKVGGEEASNELTLIHQNILPDFFTDKELRRVCIQLNYGVDEKKFYFRFSSMNVHNPKKKKMFKCVSERVEVFASGLRDFLSATIRKHS